MIYSGFLINASKKQSTSTNTYSHMYIAQGLYHPACMHISSYKVGRHLFHTGSECSSLTSFYSVYIGIKVVRIFHTESSLHVDELIVQC